MRVQKNPMEMDLVLEVVTRRHLGQQDVDRLDDGQIRRLVVTHGNDRTRGLLAVIEVMTVEHLD
jgi:hypothetical protein